MLNVIILETNHLQMYYLVRQVAEEEEEGLSF